MICPACSVDAPYAVQVATIAVCAACGSSLHVDQDGSVRRATAAETTELSDADLQALRTARGRIARPGRRQR